MLCEFRILVNSEVGTLHDNAKTSGILPILIGKNSVAFAITSVRFHRVVPDLVFSNYRIRTRPRCFSDAFSVSERPVTR